MAISTFSKSFAIGLAAALLGGLVPAQAATLPVPDAPEVGATSYYLMDYNSEYALASKKPDERVEPASITKLMTAYVVFKDLESGDLTLSEKAVISENAWRTEGSRMFIEPDTKVTIDELLKGMIIQSGNDASVALAEHVAGDEGTFATLMNRYAKELGMNNTHYTNATGLPHPDHYTTARDTAILSAALIREFPKRYELFAEKQYTYNDITQYNRNKLLWRDPSVDGLKTGHTEAAGYCLAASSRREDMRLISVVMGTEGEKARVDASRALLNYGFRFFETRKLYESDQELAQAPVWKGRTDQVSLGLADDLYVTFPRGRYDELEAATDINQRIVAPVGKGAAEGRVYVDLGDRRLVERPLVTLEPVPEGGWFGRLIDSALLLWQ